jgi:hypothetical protein
MPCALLFLPVMNVVWSYCGDLMVAANTDRAMMPDPGSYADALMSSFDDLAAATT